MSFSSDLGKFRTKAIAEVEKERKAVCIALFRSVIQDTPVDTGRAKGNWQCSADSPITTTTERTDKSKSGKAVMDEVRAVLNGLDDRDHSVHLTNNLPYIGKLEYGQYGTGPGATQKTTRDGYSVQAPTGMVRKNLARIKALILRKRLSK